jgi:hypothetical protein
MLAILRLLMTFAANLFRSRRQLEVENLFLRHQLTIALRRVPHRLRLHGSDRAVLVWLTPVANRFTATELLTPKALNRLLQQNLPSPD